MKRSAAIVATLTISLVNSVQAKCIYHPEIRAGVTIQGCVAATFGATDAKSALFGDPEPMYRSGEALAGTLLTVAVKTAKSLGPKPWDTLLMACIFGKKGRCKLSL